MNAIDHPSHYIYNQVITREVDGHTCSLPDLSEPVDPGAKMPCRYSCTAKIRKQDNHLDILEFILPEIRAMPHEKDTRSVGADTKLHIIFCIPDAPLQCREQLLSICPIYCRRLQDDFVAFLAMVWSDDEWKSFSRRCLDTIIPSTFGSDSHQT